MLTLFFTLFFNVGATRAQTLLQVEAPLAPVEGQYELRGEFDYLSTKTNFPVGGGSAATLPGGGSYSDMSGIGQLRYDFSPAWRAYAGISGAYAQASILGTNGLTNSGLNESWLGVQYWWRTPHFDLVPQADLILPFFRVDPNNITPLLGEGAISTRGGAWGLFHIGHITPFLYTGYEYRDQGRASLVNYRVGTRYRVRGSFWVQGELRGLATVVTDVNSSGQASRDAYLIQTNDDSYEFYSLNPYHGELALSGGIQLGPVGIYAGGSVAAYGNSSADEYKALIGIKFLGKLNLFKDADPSEDYGRERDETYFDSTPVKSYDDKLFRENSVVPPTPPAEPVMDGPDDSTPQIMTKPAAPKKKRRVRPEGENQGPLPSVELLMKDTTKSLEKNK